MPSFNLNDTNVYIHFHLLSSLVDAAATRCKFNNFGTGVTRAILGLNVCISRKQAQNVFIGGSGCFLIIGGGADSAIAPSVFLAMVRL